eukprot:CAMPEP_0114524564 /NCGR_PEP_ID=MMETSP0109-20121206/21928_1 /TAXON_ID=29199 /ORGANISM="Chlorarachnion reptans, Strain CCCM449" /LENGTH=514 /DNA_ID=CAMNT_0001706027 /DNA_START=68 /DNA_END=1612 /DNA_ORIENTATION=-
MAKKKGKAGKGAAGGKSANAPWKAKLAMISQIVSSYRPQKAGGTYMKETLPELIKQIGYQQKPVAELIKAQECADGKRFSPGAPGERKTRGLAFESWLRKNAPECGLDDTFAFQWEGLSEGSGVVAKKDLKKHARFIRIPRKLMITSTQASQSPIGQALMKDPTFGTMPNLMLAVHLMFESLNPESFYAPYLAALPREFSLPLFFTAEELNEMEGSPSYYDALKIQKQTLRQYVLASKLLGDRGGLAAGLKIPTFTYRDFRWAVGVVMTRQNRIPGQQDPSKSVLALIPGWDFCNFKDGEVATQYNDEVHASESFTMEDVKEGKQIYIYYGKRPNSKLFLFSGFIAEDHKSDYVEVLFSDSDTKSEIAKIRGMMLGARRLLPSLQPFRIDMKGAPSSICLTWCRINRASKAEAGTILKAKTPVIEKLSDENEKLAYSLVKENVQAALKRYPTTIDADRKFLDASKEAEKSGSGLSPNAVLCVRLRLKEKIALEMCIKHAEEVINGAGTAEAKGK